MENLINDQYLIEEVLDMTPRPTTNHMELMLEILLQLRLYFGKKCIVANESSLYLTKEDINEFKNDVIKLMSLYKNTKETIPDVAVYCDKNQRFLKGYIGVPQLVVEILSPSNAEDDLITKKELYESFGIPEYWIVSPMKLEIYQYSLNKDNRYESVGRVSFKQKIKSRRFEGLEVDLSEVELI